MSDAFDVCGPLPTGVTVLEASAGTGKTFTIAALAARYVADGVPLDQILMVTFTRMATGELRERVRERLVTAEHGLERALAGALPEDDAVVRLLADGSPTLVGLRRERLAAALADFDSATIATTHGFCQEVLGGLGVLGDVESDTTFLEDVTDLREEVVDDLYVRKFARRGTPQFTRAEAMAIARTAIDNPAAPVEPADAPENSIAALRVSLAGAARRELDARKRRTGVMTYDDLLTRLSDTLHGERGELAAARLRARYRVVLVDEFQDTDPVQWQIVRTAFGDGVTTLVLIGDPKQAIYAFRGADVYAYIEAAGTAGTQATLTVNRRSDQGLIDAYDALFGGAKLGHEGIVYRPVSAAHRAARLLGAPDPAPLRIRVVPRDQTGLTAKGFARLEPARQHVACDVAADIVGLLRSGAEVDGEGPVRPGHIAVLVRTNRTAARVRDALEEVDVPAVINGAGSVFGTEPAREWLRLLEAIERPSYPPRARSAALTLFFGWSTEEVAAADDDAWEGVHRRLHHWARVLRLKGVASLTEAITLEEGLPARVLAMVDGERRMTDLRHVGELLHSAAMTEQMGATALTAWLRARVLEATTDNNDEERSRRLESDAEAVQVLTMHRSKGLEFPVVYYPDLWEPSPTPREREPVTFHDAAGTRTIDVGLEGPQWKGHVAQHIDEQRGEDLRLAYVALTRAKHQAVVWWAGSFGSRDSALSRLLFARDGDGNVASSGSAVPSDDTALARFRELADAAQVSVEPAVLGPTVSWPGDVPATATLSASSFDRTLDWWWRRTSFSDITAGTYEPHVASEPEEPVVDDESAPVAPPVPPDGDDALRAVPSLLAEMPVGVEVGTLVHRVFESVDFAAADLSSELSAEIAAAQARRRVELGDADVVAGLRAAIETPLGALADGVALRDDHPVRPPRRAQLRAPPGRRRRPERAGADARRARRRPAHPRPPLRRASPRPTPPGERARISHRQHRSGAAARRRALRRRRLQDQLARAARRGPDRLAPPPRRADRRDDARPLRAAGAAVHGRAAPLPPLAAAGLLGGAQPRRRPLPVRARHDRAGHAGGRRHAVRRVHLAALAGARRGAERRPRPGGGRVTDVFDARLARGASGLLLEFNDAGVLAAADVHVARRLASLVGGTDDSVLLATALAVRAPRIGHVFVDLQRIHETATVDVDDPIDLTTLPWPAPGVWIAAVEASGLAGPDRPLRLEGSALYLDRYWREEQQVATDLEALARPATAHLPVLADGITRLFTGESPDDRQKQAAAAAVLRRLAVVAGGPGTGKTTTVARIVALLEEQALAAGAAPPLVALAAPTGKAAARLAEAVHTEAARLDVDPAIRARLLELEASTLHRLLGWKPGTHSRFRHDRGNRLPYDVVIVDETSMVSLSLMARLTEAVRREARLILVGDPGQLTSIEAGAVLGDIVGPAADAPRMSAAVRTAVEEATGSAVDSPSSEDAVESVSPSTDVAIGDGIVVLRTVHRFGGGIEQLADAIHAGDADAAIAALTDDSITWINADVGDPAALDLLAPVRDGAVKTGRAVIEAAEEGDAARAIRELGAFRVLCAHRRGPHGVATWMPRIETWLAGELPGFAAEPWYVGRPLLVTENDHAIRLYNGDTGVVVTSATGRPTAAFERQGEIVYFSPTRLAAVETVYAMTVHKSQGSQFATAAVLLPDPASPILTRELLYTAVTRAQTHLVLAGTEEAVRAAVDRPIARASGLQRRLWG